MLGGHRPTAVDVVSPTDVPTDNSEGIRTCANHQSDAVRSGSSKLLTPNCERTHDMRHTILLLAVLASQAAAAQDTVPDHERTPGAVNPEVTQDNLQETVCAAGWTEKISPPEAKLEKLKAKQVKQLHLKGPAKNYHEDHLVPLCAGGHPTDPRNLWPQRVEGDWNYKVKDQLETAVCKALCSGDLTLEQARSMFLEPDWTKVFLKFYQVE